MKKFSCILLALILLTGALTVSANASSTQAIQFAGQVNTTSGNLNVRSSASTTATIKTTLAKNSYVSVITDSGNFYYVQYKENAYGYVHKNYIENISSNIKTVSTSSGSLRVRSFASLSSNVKAYLSAGTPVAVLSVSGNFSKILYNGNAVGYVYSDYLINAIKSISLNVPSFKQTDSRWANVEIGSSGKTIGEIGCVTTALAMTESYKTGTTIYPNQMAQKLSYTSGGAVYWPTNYNIITSSSGYLNKIYEILQSGKPVILGAKKSNGSQHYVVITGVKSGSNLTTSSFYINDPGSSTRTTLNQFLAVYPTFYKMIYAK